MNIRQATEDDLPSILNLYAQPSIDNGEKLSLEQAKALFVVMATYPDYKLYLAEINDRPVGTFALLIMHNLGHMGAPSGLVESVAVTPDQHGQGIGRAMMQFAMERCRDAGCYKMALSANLKRDKAHRFYESLGFQRHGYSFLMPLD